MYVGDHVDIRICPVCGNTLTPPSDGGCAICWHGSERGVLVHDNTSGGVMVHPGCLRFFGVDTVAQFERRHYDI